MNPALKKFSEEAKAKIAALMTDSAKEHVIVKADDADSGTFEVIVSTEDRDRQGESVLLSGWDLSFYKLNPVVLWAHDYGSLPIGVCTDIQVIGQNLVAKGKFAAHEFAQDCRQLYDDGMLKTTSVGFIPKAFDPNNDEIITQAELLEFSFVPVPANPYAISLRKLGMLKTSREVFATKGIEFKVKEVVGSRCQLDDGTPGILIADPKNPKDAMICVPSKGMQMEDADAKMQKAIDIHKAFHAPAHAEHKANHEKAIATFKADMAKDVDMGDEQGDAKAYDISKCDSFKALCDAMEFEDQRHSSAVENASSELHNAVDEYKNDVAKCLSMFPDSPDTGDDDGDGGEPTANEVRLIQTIKSVFGHIDSAHSALKAIAEAEGETKTAVKVEDNSGKDDGHMDVNSFINDRELLRTLDVAIGKVLKFHNRQDRSRA